MLNSIVVLTPLNHCFTCVHCVHCYQCDLTHEKQSVLHQFLLCYTYTILQCISCVHRCGRKLLEWWMQTSNWWQYKSSEMLCCVNLLSSWLPNPDDDDGITSLCNICNYLPIDTIWHFRDVHVHQHHSENLKSCTFQSVNQIIIQFDRTSSLSHTVYLIYLMWEARRQHMWWCCPVRIAFVLHVQGSDLQIFFAIDNLFEFAVGD